MKNIFFSADTHFNHANIIHFCKRDFVFLDFKKSAKWNREAFCF